MAHILSLNVSLSDIPMNRSLIRATAKKLFCRDLAISSGLTDHDITGWPANYWPPTLFPPTNGIACTARQPKPTCTKFPPGLNKGRPTCAAINATPAGILSGS